MTDRMRKLAEKFGEQDPEELRHPEAPSYRVRNSCRLCGNEGLDRVVDLPATPLANEFPSEPSPDQDEFPLFLSRCSNCCHVQLPVVVDPERLFRDYVYVSGTSPAFVEHFRSYAESLFPLLGSKSDLVVEVGSNDGTMLRFFKEAGFRILGIDPARDVATKATESGIETWPEFLSAEVADRVVAQRGAAKLVVANNVFAHVDDLIGFASAAKRMLEPGGFFVFEVGYLVDVLRKVLVDNIYHEHLSYHHVAPLVPFFAKLGMTVMAAHRVDTHGGSIRVFVSNEPRQAAFRDVGMFVEKGFSLGLVVEEFEFGLAGSRGNHGPFEAFASEIDERKKKLRKILLDFVAKGSHVAGYGAPAKATTLLRVLGMHRGVLDFVVDDNPRKQGKFMPGTSIPVLPSSAITECRPNVVVVLAWNFAEQVLAKLEDFRNEGGVVVVPLPSVRVF